MLWADACIRAWTHSMLQHATAVLATETSLCSQGSQGNTKRPFRTSDGIAAGEVQVGQPPQATEHLCRAGEGTMGELLNQTAKPVKRPPRQQLRKQNPANRSKGNGYRWHAPAGLCR